MRDCALVLYKYAFLFVPECGVPRQVVQRLSIGPAPSGAFPLVRVRCRPGALLLLFFFLPSSSFFLISPRLDFSFYNVVIPELCFLFYNNRGHYTGLILVCIPFSVFERNFVFYSVRVVLLKVEALPFARFVVHFAGAPSAPRVGVSCGLPKGRYFLQVSAVLCAKF